MASIKLRATLALVGLGLLGGGCAPMQLQQTGYAATNKVWYHWANQNKTEHKLIVCDVAPDGSESNCKESDMKTISFLAIEAALGAVGCAQPRELIQPRSATAQELNYIYFVEQEQKKDSRLKRCEINADNTAKCAVQFDLK